MTSRLSPQQLEKVLQLRQQRFSIRDIADELAVPKSRIEWALTHLNSTESDQQVVSNPVIERQLTELTEQQQQIAQERQQLDGERQVLNQKAQILAQQEQQLLSRTNSYAVTTRQHTQQLQDLAQRQHAFAQERQAFEIRQQEFQRELQSMPKQEDTYELYRQRSQQEKLVNRYNRLVQELLNNSSDCRWTGDEVEEYLERLDSLKLKVTALCQVSQLDERRLLLFQGIDFLIGEVEEEQNEQTSGLFSGSSVCFNYSDVYQAKISAYIVQTFDQQTSNPSPSMAQHIGPAGIDDEDDE